MKKLLLSALALGALTSAISAETKQPVKRDYRKPLAIVAGAGALVGAVVLGKYAYNSYAAKALFSAEAKCLSRIDSEIFSQPSISEEVTRMGNIDVSDNTKSVAQVLKAELQSIKAGLKSIFA